MKKHVPMNKLEFLMKVEQLGGWRWIQVRVLRYSSPAITTVRKFWSEDDYHSFTGMLDVLSDRIVGVESRPPRAAPRKREVTDPRAGRW